MRLDIKFGSRGRELSDTTLPGLTLQTDGQILVGGFPRVRRFSPFGRLTSVFDEVTFPNQPPNQFVQNGPDGLKQRANGTIIGVKSLVNQGYDDVGVVVFNNQGQAIAYDQQDFFGGDDYCSGLIIQPDGKILMIVAAQLQRQGSYSFAAIRYTDITP